MKKKKPPSPKTNKPSKRKEKAERMQKAIEIFGKSKKSIQNAAWLARRIRPDIREYADKLSMRHLEAVATLHPDDQKQILDVAIEDKLTAKQTAAAVRVLKLGEEKFVLDHVERMKSEFKKLADKYRDWSILKDVVTAIDEFVEKEFEYIPTKTDDTPPTDTPPTPEQK
ncbi:MAG TPA: hypothetical protein VMH23_09100, partial [Bacteroidota bacterium]|nr:hypothetical protein [Bacteroidota bacterium]